MWPSTDYAGFVRDHLSSGQLAQLEDELAPRWLALVQGRAGRWLVFRGGTTSPHFANSEETGFEWLKNKHAFPTPALIRQMPLGPPPFVPKVRKPDSRPTRGATKRP